MKRLMIDRNSWHYRWMEKFNIAPSTMDICAYTRALMKAVFVTLLLACLAVLTIISFGDFFSWVTVMILSWQWIDPEPWSLIVVFFVGTILIVGAIFCVNKFWKKLPEPPEDIKAMWDSVHNKICVPIEISQKE
jgi:NADH:ubiquinone oxidoreductase subunit 5 (subunit L)/multisubunit Na+/H+ antiporter MnhA subunit